MSSAALHIMADLGSASPCELIVHAVAGDRSREVHATKVTEDDWLDYRLVLVEDDATPLLAARWLPKRPGVIVIGHNLDDHTVWQRAGQIGARAVAFLPDSTEWLVGLILTAAGYVRAANADFGPAWPRGDGTVSM